MSILMTISRGIRFVFALRNLKPRIDVSTRTSGERPTVSFFEYVARYSNISAPLMVASTLIIVYPQNGISAENPRIIAIRVERQTAQKELATNLAAQNRPGTSDQARATLKNRETLLRNQINNLNSEEQQLSPK
jgi:hypothetical protein